MKVVEVSKVVSENVAGALPWEMILELVISMIDRCFPRSENLVSYARNNDGDVGPVKKAVAVHVIRKETGLRRKDAIKLRDELFTSMDTMTDDELKVAHAEVIKELVPSNFVI